MLLKISKYFLYYHTLRYLKLSQIFWRVRYKFYIRFPRNAPQPVLKTNIKDWCQPVMAPQSVYDSTVFYFLNEYGNLSDVGWNGTKKSKLWRYNQHYFNDLNAIDAHARLTWHKNLIDSWVAKNTLGQGVGWDPYPTSLRIVNWLKWYLAGNLLTDHCTKSLVTQIRWLSNRIEWHLLGNHLFANAKALIFAGLIFDGVEAKKWLSTGLKIVDRELGEQVLPDGGNFERSPMYHAIFLEDLLDLINIYSACLPVNSDSRVSSWCALASNMMGWLKGMCHPDGDISFFNDACLGIAPKFKDLNLYANKLGIFLGDEKCSKDKLYISNYSDSGYIRLENEDAVLIIDVGQIGPDYQPGHAHADTLSFELSLFGQRVIVNGGVSEYGDGPIRFQERSTLSHNTVEINGLNSSEVWSGFRVARRAFPHNLKISRGVDAALISCSHDGYKRLKGSPEHARLWSFLDGRLVIEDRINGVFQSAVARFHFHPKVNVQQLNETTWLLELKDVNKKILFKVIEGEAALVNGFHSPEFGNRLDSICLENSFNKDFQVKVEILWNVNVEY